MAGGGPADETLIELLVVARRSASRIVGQGAADDIASETVLRALTHWHRVSDHAERWVTVVAANLSIDLVRRRRLALPSPTTDSFEDTTIDRIALTNALRRLPRRQRQVLVLHHLVGLTDHEVASALEVSLSSVKTHLERGLKGLRLSYRPEEEEVPVVRVRSTEPR